MPNSLLQLDTSVSSPAESLDETCDLTAFTTPV